MAPDYRSDRMDSPEGKGRARRAWEAYVQAVSKHSGPLMPAIEPLVRPFAMNMTADLLGFWLCWHLEGGFEGLRRVGFSRSGIYRRVRRFRQVTGQHPDEFSMPGVSIDLEQYQRKAAGAIVPGVETTGV